MRLPCTFLTLSIKKLNLKRLLEHAENQLLNYNSKFRNRPFI